MDVKTLCLGVLSKSEASGYEIRKQFEDGCFSYFQEAGFGSIYPALKKLTDDRLVTCEQQSQDARPDKKVYRITSKGRQALFDAVNEEPAGDKVRSDFMFIAFFAELIPPRDLDRLLGNRIAYHRAVVEKLGSRAMQQTPGQQTPGQRFVLHMGLHIHKAALEYLENHRHELIGAQLQTNVAE